MTYCCWLLFCALLRARRGPHRRLGDRLLDLSRCPAWMGRRQEDDMTVKDLIDQLQRQDLSKEVWLVRHRHIDMGAVTSAEETVISDDGHGWSVGASDDPTDETRIVVLIE